MAHAPALLDTDIISAIMRGEPVVVSRAREYLAEHRHFTFSVITRYEILRGLMVKGAVRQTAAFEAFCAASQVLPLDDAAAARAAEIYSDLTARGAHIGDADILIAASALVNGLAVVTNNEDHYRRVPGLVVANWLK